MIATIVCILLCARQSSRIRRMSMLGLLVCLPGTRQDVACQMPYCQSGMSANAVAAFVDVNVIPMDSERVVPHQTVLVQDGRISAMGDATSIKIPSNAVRIDGRGKFLMPGIADMHSHIDQPRFFVGSERDDGLSVDQRLFLWLASGVTTVRNLQMAEGTADLRVKQRVANGELLSPRIYTAIGAKAYPLLDQNNLRRAVDSLKAMGYDFIKLHNVNMHPELFDSLGAAARAGGLSWGGHIPVNIGIYHALEAHIGTIEHLYGYREYFLKDLSIKAYDSVLAANGWTLARIRLGLDSLADATVRNGVWNCPTMFVQGPLFVHTADGDTISLNWAIFRTLHRAGAGLLLGTDAAGFVDAGSSIHDELAKLVEHGGISPFMALAMGTRNVAQFFGASYEGGIIAPGKWADLVLLPGNPLKDIRQTVRPEGVMIGGKWLPRDTLDSRLAILHNITDSVRRTHKPGIATSGRS